MKEENELIKDNFVELTKPLEKDKGPGKFLRKDEVEVGIHFDMSAMSKEQLDKLFQAEQLLRDIGVSFDTGAGGGERDWEWDWSLTGPVHVTFRRMVKDNPKNRYIRSFLPKEDFPDSDCGVELADNK